MNEITLLESQTLRNELCKEVNLAVLNRVGKLVTLSDEDYALAEGVCGFYEIKPDILRQTVCRHREELESDGYKILSNKEFRELHDVTLKSKARQIALFSRRSVLRIGMLLRDSKVAKQVRTYLLDVEAHSHPSCLLSQSAGKSFQAHVLGGLASLLESQGATKELMAETLLSERVNLQQYLSIMFKGLFENQELIFQKLENLEKKVGSRQKPKKRK